MKPDSIVAATVMELNVVIETAVEKLASLSMPKAWLSTKALARLMGVNSTKAFSLLISETESPDRRVRYCMYPSRRDLDVLWGHISVVGDRNLAPLTREALPEEFHSGRPQAETAAPEPGMFLSHTLRDFSDVYELREKLEADGRKVWLFEDDMPLGAIIHHHVSAVIESSETLGVYLTQQFLGSLYGDKEVGQIWYLASEKPVRIFFNASSRWLIELAFDSHKASFNDQKAKIDKALSKHDGLEDRQANLVGSLIDLVMLEACELIYHQRQHDSPSDLAWVLENKHKSIQVI